MSSNHPATHVVSNDRVLEVVTQSQKETFELGYGLGQSLRKPRVFFLEGSLGAGKTAFAKGLICGLGMEDADDVTSPSFTLINEYPLRLKVYHIDLFRLKGKQDLDSLDLEEIFAEDAVVLVEWAEKLKGYALNEVTLVRIEDLGGNQRKIYIGPLPKSRKNGLR